MPLPALAIMALAAGGSALANVIGKQKNTVPNPEKYKDAVTLSDADIGGIRAAQLGQLARLNMGVRQDVKQYAGANRLPAGAALSALAGSSYNLARGASEIEAPLQEAKLQSEQNYAGMQQQYDQGQLQAQQANRDMWAGTVGDLSSIAMMWSGGMFDAPAGGGLAGNTPGTQSGLAKKGIGVGLNSGKQTGLPLQMLPQMRGRF